MSIQVAIRHRTEYEYERLIDLGPQVIRLRPAPHCRTPVLSYSLKVLPTDHFLNWQQDPHGNYLARLLFTNKVRKLSVDVEVIADMTVINPFDFFLEADSEEYPIRYERDVEADLKPFLECADCGPSLTSFLTSVDRTPRRTIDFLVDLNRHVQQEIDYVVRMEPGVQCPEETLAKKSGSCRDSGWLLVQILRQLGLAARFTSGYLVQLRPDEKPLAGPEGPTRDFTDLHAWAEVYLPGAGWIGLDPTSGLLAGEGHIPLACTPSPHAAAPITGSHEPCECRFEFSMDLDRVHEVPRVTLPYSEQTWQRIIDVGHHVDRQLKASDVRLTMGGEPTFVSMDDMDSAQWQTEALGDDKYRLANQMLNRLRQRFAPGGLLHYGQGKWYPGEALPRWAMKCYWRKDGQPVWNDANLFAATDIDYQHNCDDAERFTQQLATRLGLDSRQVIAAFEDPIHYLWQERRLPINVDVHDNRLEDEQERARLARIFEQGITAPVGCVLPLQYCWWEATPRWRSGLWRVRSDEMFLIPGDSPMGYRLPIASLIWVSSDDQPTDFFAPDPLEPRAELPAHAELRRGLRRDIGGPRSSVIRQQPLLAGVAANAFSAVEDVLAGRERDEDSHQHLSGDGHNDIVRTALCVEPRNGKLHVFLPPTDRLEPFLNLITAIEDTAASLQTPVVLEGYQPPHDARLNHLSVTPDPGVIEVNVHPAASWDDLVDITTHVYHDARQTRLGTEKFDIDGTHTGTGGGNHVVLGGPTPQDSPFLRRPDLLKSLVGYWHNHPSLSYLFSGRFVGPTSQAPRVDEGRVDSLYELEIGLEQISPEHSYPPWFVDRVFRNLLVDVTGNTHRAEFCIDKLYSPDGAAGRLGLVEFRAFEMPPHARMSLTQQLLIRALIARFWDHPYSMQLVHWGTSLHDRFMLPHFLWQDFADVVAETYEVGFPVDLSWYRPHFEFRMPKLGTYARNGIEIELRQAIEPWYVLGEERGAGYMARYVDSSVERIQVLVRGMTDSRHVVKCNGRALPLHPTGTEGEFVAGLRYRAWQPPSCLHPTIPVDSPLTIDLVDTWMHKSLGGCQFYVGHPGGVNPDTFPVNANEAESRRSARFVPMGHTPGRIDVRPGQPNPRMPMTLDLRRGRWED